MEKKQDPLKEMYAHLSHRQLEAVMAMLEDAAHSTLLTREGTCLLVTHGIEDMYIPFDKVLEVLRLKDYKINEIPCENPKVRGMINVRGQLIPLVHLSWCNKPSALIKECRHDHALCKMIVIIENQSTCFGLLVHRVIGIREIKKGISLVDVEKLY